MSGIEGKLEAQKQAWIRAEALKISNVLQAKQVADLVDQNSADIVKTWIKAEVEAAVRAAADGFPDMIEDAVNRYCRSVFVDDAHTAHDGHFDPRPSRNTVSRRNSVSDFDIEFIEAGTRPPSRASAPITSEQKDK